ncbi:reverse transcriptase family protein [Microlunatus phosphovorus]|uniref:reverse transcriptase family protein n=1 Tax=Microlunatus phosphovorus TaxID=29405 RepID=UPI00155ADBA9|nr:reverse transcriptase family protein [Microlunatus phosphovorus]
MRELELKMGYAPGSLDRLARIFDAGAGHSVIRISSGKSKTRHVVRPTVALDGMLKSLRRVLEAELGFEPMDCVHGCVRGRSILTNASMHLARPVVLRVDLKDFFDSISTSDISDAFKVLDVDDETAELLARCTTIHGRMRAGLSTSPLLANLVFNSTDRDLQEIAARLDLTYTRYVDDLVFSGETITDDTLATIAEQIVARGWTINARKTRFMRSGGAQYVTGLSVDVESGPHLPRRMKRFLRLEVHYATLHGFGSGSTGKRRLIGLINYAKCVEPWLGAELHDSIREAGLLVGRSESEDAFEDAEDFWDELGLRDEY